MPTVRLHMTSALSAPELMAVLTDFSSARPNVWPSIEADHFEVHAVGDTWAEVTEGIASAWERARYEWDNQRRRVTVTTHDSKVFGPGGGWVFQLTPEASGTPDRRRTDPPSNDIHAATPGRPAAPRRPPRVEEIVGRPVAGQVADHVDPVPTRDRRHPCPGVAATVNPAPKSAVRFADIPGRTSRITIPTRYGPVPSVLYHPSSDVESPPVYVNVHGGGFVVGHPEQDDPWCRYLAANAGVVVVNPDYVLAPRHRFPAAPQQLYDIVCWAADAARDWDGTRLCVGGQSAGGNLAAAAARLTLEHHTPVISLQVLRYAPLDLVTPLRDKPSTIGARAVMKPWMGEVFDTAYIPDRAQRRHRLASPAWGPNADGIVGIAPAVVVTAEHDRLRDEARRYAEKLDTAGSLVEYHEVAGVDHGYNIMSDAVDVTRSVYSLIASHVARATAQP